MKNFIKVSPAELMLIEVALGEYNKLVQLAEQQKQQRLASIAASHPEAKDFKIEQVDGDLCLVYETPDAEPPVPPVKKSRRNVL